MRKTRIIELATKTFVYWVAFMALHFAYDLFKTPIMAMFSGTSESIFQHMKIGFWAWLVASLIEWPFASRRNVPAGAFFDSRIFAACFLPMCFAAVWYLSAAVVGPLPDARTETIWANIVVITTALWFGSLERTLESKALSVFQKIGLYVFAAILVFLMARFTYFELPWTDLFAEPRPTY